MDLNLIKLHAVACIASVGCMGIDSQPLQPAGQYVSLGFVIR